MSDDDRSMLLASARLHGLCLECGAEIPGESRSAYCSRRCLTRDRDRRRRAAGPAKGRAKARSYYWANRDEVLRKAAAKRQELAAVREAERAPLACSECGSPLTGARRVICSARCQQARWRRMNPEAARERERRKTAKKAARRRAARTDAGQARQEGGTT